MHSHISGRWQVRSSDQVRAGAYESLAVRLELACGAFLHTLPSDQVELLFSTPKGSDVLEKAQRSGCKILVGQPKVQTTYRHLWYGRLLKDLSEAAVT